MAFVLVQADPTSDPNDSRVIAGAPTAVFTTGGGKGVVEDKNVILTVNMFEKGKIQAGMTIGINELAMALYSALDFDRTSQVWENDTLRAAHSWHEPDPVKHMKRHREELAEFISEFEKTLAFMKADLPRYDSWIERYEEE